MTVQPDAREKGETLTFHLSKRDIELLQRYLEEHGEDPCKWKKAARRYAKEGIYNRIKAYLDAIII
jgi:hypothetical protein